MRMKKGTIKLLSLVVALVLLVWLAFWGSGRFVFLSPNSYESNENLTTNENYFIRKKVLEYIENRYSVLGDKDAVDLPSQKRHLFIFINNDFMKSVIKHDGGYTLQVKSFNLEQSSEDCVFEIHFSKELDITEVMLDP